jgi:hypothetical protein
MSLTPILLTVELSFLFVVARRYRLIVSAVPSMRPVYGYVLWLTAYGILTSVLGARGVWVSEPVLRTLPGLWLQPVTVAVVVLPVVVFVGLRDAMRRIVDGTPWQWFAYFHALRLAALGTAYKTAIGEFPASFEYGVGIPDLLFGASALWIAGRARRGDLSEKTFLVWNVAGALAIVPAAPILLQLGLPGPLQIFTTRPDARAILTYPMSIAPVIGVPLFVLANVWVAWRLWERRRASREAPAARPSPIRRAS